MTPTKQYYEMHVTFMGEIFTGSCPGFENWKYSRIDGDPVLGSGVKQYLTKHVRVGCLINMLQDEVEALAEQLRTQGFNVLRTKIELVVYDNRTKNGVADQVVEDIPMHSSIEETLNRAALELKAGRSMTSMDIIIAALDTYMGWDDWEGASDFVDAYDPARYDVATSLVVLSLIRLDEPFKKLKAKQYEAIKEHIRKVEPDRHIEILQGLQ